MKIRGVIPKRKSGALFRKENKGRYSEKKIRGVIPKWQSGALFRNENRSRSEPKIAVFFNRKACTTCVYRALVLRTEKGGFCAKAANILPLIDCIHLLRSVLIYFGAKSCHMPLKYSPSYFRFMFILFLFFILPFRDAFIFFIQANFPL